jgi:hypothetical protein
VRTICERVSAQAYLQDVEDYTRVGAVLVDSLGETRFDSAYASGRSSTPEDVARSLEFDDMVIGAQNG